jgi:hypothetical protein
MDDFYPIGFFLMFTSFLLLSIFRGEKTSHKDEELNDYWSDG